MLAETVALTNSSLFRDRAFVDGQWIDSLSGGRFPVTNPAHGSRLAEVPDMDAEDTNRAIEAASRAFPGWSGRLASERSGLLRRWNDLILENAEDLALLMTMEQGKPLKESAAEITYAAGFIEWFAEEAKRAYGDIIPSHAHDKRILALKQPVGVVGVITPWNFPAAMITRKIGAALAVGCTAVIKPAGATPLTALGLAKLAEEAGMPPGVINVITTNRSSEVGEALLASPLVRKISFTGSTEVGKRLMKGAADTVKRVSLELGGNAPFIVFDDADLDAAIEGGVASKYRNAGQTCVCANRFFVQESILEEFAERLIDASSRLKVGEGTAENVDIGPLIDEKAFEKVESLLSGALKMGAEVKLGGGRHALGGTFFEPTVVKGGADDMDIAKVEIFGPVSVLYSFKDEEEALRRANDTPYGLAAYFYARDNARIWRVSEGLEYGIVGVNTGRISTPVAPFGGMKEAGFGREGSKYGIDEYLETKYVCVGGL